VTDRRLAAIHQIFLLAGEGIIRLCFRFFFRHVMEDFPPRSGMPEGVDFLEFPSYFIKPFSARNPDARM